jgi:nitrogen fixation protein NifX
MKTRKKAESGDAMRVAFATDDGRHVGGQLRRAVYLVVYQVTAKGSWFERLCSFKSDLNRSEDRIEAIADAAVVYVEAIGPSLAARLGVRGIRPATARAGTAIEELLSGLEQRLAAGGDLAGNGTAADLCFAADLTPCR